MYWDICIDFVTFYLACKSFINKLSDINDFCKLVKVFVLRISCFVYGYFLDVFWMMLNQKHFYLVFFPAEIMLYLLLSLGIMIFSR